MTGSDAARVELIVGDGGRVTIYGAHHVRGGEYEYAVTIDESDVPTFADALGTTVEGIPTAWRAQESEIVRAGEPQWLKSHGVKYEFRSWMTKE